MNEETGVEYPITTSRRSKTFLPSLTWRLAHRIWINQVFGFTGWEVTWLDSGRWWYQVTGELYSDSMMETPLAWTTSTTTRGG